MDDLKTLKAICEDAHAEYQNMLAEFTKVNRKVKQAQARMEKANAAYRNELNRVITETQRARNGE